MERGNGFGVQGSGLAPSGVLPFNCVRKRFSGFCRFYGFSGEGAAQKIMKRREVLIALRAHRHLERSREIFLALRSVSHKYRYGNDALVLRISAFTHPSFSDLQERFLASLEMTIRESDVS